MPPTDTKLPTAPLEIAVAQLNSQDDIPQNLEVIDKLARKAKASGAQLLALPEGCSILGEAEKKRATAEPMPTIGKAPTEGLVLTTLSALARELELDLFAGGLAIASDDPKRPWNAHVVIGPRGAVRAIYRKIHLFDVDLADGTTLRESDSSARGTPDNDTVVVDVVPRGSNDAAAWRFGLSICYDVRFPELYRKLVDRGAHALMVPAAFTVPTGKDHWHVLMRARAIESQCYLAAAAQYGRHPQNRLTYGKSLVVDPWGDVIAQASDGVGLVRATFDPKRLADVRAQLPSLRHRCI